MLLRTCALLLCTASIAELTLAEELTTASHRDAAANADASRARRWCSLASGRNLLQSARDRRRPDHRRGNPDFTAGPRLSANGWNLYTGAGCRLANNHRGD